MQWGHLLGKAITSGERLEAGILAVLQTARSDDGPLTACDEIRGELAWPCKLPSSGNMKIHMDRILRQCVEQELEGCRLGRNSERGSKAACLARTLMKYEERGYAMRYVDTRGRVAWKAPPWLRDLITD